MHHVPGWIKSEIEYRTSALLASIAKGLKTRRKMGDIEIAKRMQWGLRSVRAVTSGKKYAWCLPAGEEQLALWEAQTAVPDVQTQESNV